MLGWLSSPLSPFPGPWLGYPVSENTALTVVRQEEIRAGRVSHLSSGPNDLETRAS